MLRQFICVHVYRCIEKQANGETPCVRSVAVYVEQHSLSGTWTPVVDGVTNQVLVSDRHQLAISKKALRCDRYHSYQVNWFSVVSTAS